MSDSVLEISPDCSSADLIRALAAKGEAGYVLVDKKILDELIHDIEEEIETNSKWNRDEIQTKSERRKSVLFTRLEYLQWFKERLDKLLDSRKVKVVRKEAKA